MRRINTLLLGLCLFLFAEASVSYAEGNINATVSDSQVIIDGKIVRSSGFNIKNYNYFRLRDLASHLSGSDSQFDITWNNAQNAIELTTDKAYSAKESFHTPYYSSGKLYEAKLSTAKVIIDGELHSIRAYNIEDNTYFQLRDLAQVLKFDVSFDSGTNRIVVNPYLPENAYQAAGTKVGKENTVQSYFSRWSEPIRSHLISNSDGTFSSVTVDEEHVRIDSYNKDYEVTSSKELPLELPHYGAFYNGEKYNYIAYGQDNEEENNSKEVIRVVRYDKSFNRIDSVSIKGGESITIQPFRSAAPRMAENGDELVLHTSRLRYTGSDGKNHQSQLTLIINTSNMSLTNDIGAFQKNHVSHSFDQFVKYDGKEHVLVDHGDAYPRSIVLHKGNGSQYKEVDLLRIPGNIGANMTGVSLGGMEISSTHYITAYNKVDYSKVQSFTNFEMVGLDKDVRDIMLAVVPRTNLTSDKVNNITIAKYTSGTDHIGSVPKLVKIDDNRFMVLWQEFDHERMPLGVRYVEVDGSGNVVGEINSIPKFVLSDCDPVIVEDEIIWFVDKKGKRIFYTIPLNEI
ncbi:hypothetical protein [Paenibacillus lentus]|uniref:Copper amine oxidase-like N-terminal domain-containing protein n=1 Tax=Paenibacillus lentus TaxID=1338368 RepID=A0A3Q8S6B1_9BACL|nr:hypothetical protein [Paenibacillus lentus]AZK48457.1 hypothetical protein EIM92_21655 [Paenibacillus lentus]